MPLENRPEKEIGRRPAISPVLRRALVFVLLGPAIGALASWSVVAVMTRGPVDSLGIPPSYLISLIVCAITGPVDGLLANVAPIWLRAPLTAAVGAAVAVGVLLFLVALLGIKGALPPLLLALLLIVGAFATGISSLLSHNCRGAQL